MKITFPPSIEELEESEEFLYAVCFDKDYDLELALSFMRLNKYSCAYLIHTEKCSMFYQEKSYVPYKGSWANFDRHLPQELVSSVIDGRFRFMSLFDKKIVIIICSKFSC